MTPELEFRAGFVANSRMVQDLSFPIAAMIDEAIALRDASLTPLTSSTI
jgi:hypothetical protein